MTLIDIIFVIFAIIMMGILLFYGIKNENNTSKNIAVFSGSFNPIHIGHKTIIDYLSKNFDWVYVIVTPQNPNKDKIKESYDSRLQKVSDAIIENEYFNVTVNKIEESLKPPYYTISTLKKLKEIEPNNNFKMVMGADCLEDIKEWKSYDEILKDFGVIVFPRSKITVKKLQEMKNSLLYENKNYKIDIAKVKTPTISSTEIRRAINLGENVDTLLM